MSEALASLAQQAAGRPTPAQKTEAAAHVFRVLHGFYGNLFLSKFSTGQVNADGADGGVESAKAVWGHGLSQYAAEVVRDALGRCQSAHPEFPPSWPQFRELCEAAKPRQTFAEQQGWKSLPPPAKPRKSVEFEHRNDGKDWARSILAQVEAGLKKTPTVVLMAEQALGLKPQNARIDE